MIKLSTQDNYSSPEKRKQLAEFLAHTYEGERLGTFEPYKPNERDDYFWTFDMGNNWKVRFFADEPNVFEIRNRYNTNGD
jgi:hypothetical protein